MCLGQSVDSTLNNGNKYTYILLTFCAIYFQIIFMSENS